jgi:hypothetical protein
MQIYDIIHDRYQNINIIASTIDDLCLQYFRRLISSDYHYYRTPGDLNVRRMVQSTPDHNQLSSVDMAAGTLARPRECFGPLYRAAAAKLYI